MVPISNLSEPWELATLRPVELTPVNDNATHASPMATNPFCCAVGDDIRAELKWSLDIAAHTKGVVADQWDSSIMCNFRDCGNIWNVVLGVANCLDIHSSRLVVNSSGNCFWVLTFNPLDYSGSWC